MADPVGVRQGGKGAWARILVYGLLVLAALWFLAPLYVMLVTSLKTLDEIRAGNLLSPPGGLNLDAWEAAWSSACTGVRCEGLSGYFWNSVRMVVPAVAISTLIGATQRLCAHQVALPGLASSSSPCCCSAASSPSR